MNTITKTLDHIEKWEISINPLEENANEFWCLNYLWQGMALLAHQVQKFELIVQEKLDPSFTCSFSGNAIQLEGIPQDLITSYFDWYAVSACKYVKLICKIANNHGAALNKERTNSHAERIIPALVTYRDKIASKFCYTSHNKQDNKAEKMMSIMPQLTFDDNAFIVAAYQLLTHGSNSASLTKLSLTETHKILTERYIGSSQ